MQLAEKRFVLSYNLWAWESSNWGTLCFDEVAGRFDIPSSVDVIWVSLHDRPGANRWPATVYLSYASYRIVVAEHEGQGDIVVDDSAFDHMLSRVWKRVGERTIYVEVRYEP